MTDGAEQLLRLEHDQIATPEGIEIFGSQPLLDRAILEGHACLEDLHMKADIRGQLAAN